MSKVKRPRESSIVKGLLAGLVGGIAGCGARLLASKIYAPYGSAPGTPSPEAQPQVQDAIKPWIVGAAAGAVYGAAMEIEPSAGVWGGAGFGLGLRKFTNSTLGANSVDVSVRQSTRQRQSEWVSYAVFGVVTEGVRRLVRKGL